MKKIIKEIEVFDFDELNKEIQEKLIKEKKEHMVDSYAECFLLEDMEEKAKELLQKYFKNNAEFKKVQYSLNWCQGDGAMIEFDLIYYNKPVKIRHHGYYSHQNSFIIDSYDLTEKQEKQLKSKIYNMNDELATFGYESLEYYFNADEEAKEALQNYTFLKDGTIYD